MKTTLKNIASIQTGVFAKPALTGDLVYLQARHFDENGQLLGSPHPDLHFNDFSEKHILRINDVLFASKGTKNFAIAYEDYFPPSVASTSFFVIRLQNDSILPQYLAWYLNNPDSQQFLKCFARGTSIASISKAVLEEMEIGIPGLKTQQLILKIAQLRDTEKKIKQKIETHREKLIQHMIINAIK